MLSFNAIRARREAWTPEWVVTLVGIGIAVSLLGDSAMYIILPVEFSQAGIVATDVGLMLAANRAIRILINSPYGVIIERIPRRWMMVPSLTVGGIASLLYIVPGFWPMLIGRLFWGIAWAGLTLGGTSMVLDVATDTNRGQLVGRLQMWFFIGVGVSSLLGGVLFDLLGYNMTFLISAILILAGAVLWWLMLPETHDIRSKKSDNEPEAVDTPKSKNNAKPIPVFTLSIAILIHGLNWFIFIGTTISILPVLLQERIGNEIGLLWMVVPLISFTGILSAFNTVISLTASPISGWFTDRSGNRWSLVFIGLAVGVISVTVEATAQGGIIIIATMFNALVHSILLTQITALVGDYAQNRRGRILGIMNTVGDFGGAAGPLLAFPLLAIIGLEGILGLSAIALALLLPVTGWIMWRERPALSKNRSV